MSNYTKEEQEFLDKAAIACMQGMAANPDAYAGQHAWIHDNSMFAYRIAIGLLTERKKLFGDE